MILSVITHLSEYCGITQVILSVVTHLSESCGITQVVLSAVTHLSEGHLGDDCQHDLLPLGGVRVLLVLVEPGLECGC